jgi:hypothetical protein
MIGVLSLMLAAAGAMLAAFLLLHKGKPSDLWALFAIDNASLFTHAAAK